MINKKIKNLLLSVSLAANVMVFVTWVLTDILGFARFEPVYLFKNMAAFSIIVGVNAVIGWFYTSNNVNHFILGIVHLLIALATFVSVGVWATWFPLDFPIIASAVVMFIVIFFILWLFHYFYWKKQIQKMNLHLQ